MKKINLNISARTMVVALALVTSLLSCKKDDEETIVYGNAKFKLVNAFEGSTAQDFYQGTEKINATAIAYGEMSDYLTVKAGNTTAFFKSANSQTVSASLNIGVNTDVNYTVFYAKNISGSGEIIGFPESNAIPPSGKSGVRFINLSAGLSNAILVTTNLGQPITTGLLFGNITGYAVVDPLLELKFSLVGSTAAATSIPASSFQSGKLYTVWFDSSDATTLKYHIVSQN